MIYIKIIDGAVATYPYDIGMLRQDNPQTSFPENPTDELLAEWGVYHVKPTEMPVVNLNTSRVVESTPTLQDTGWVQEWQVTDLSAEEIQEKISTLKVIERNKRNQILSETDWTQIKDAPLSEAEQISWANYRQALRDLPEQEGFPLNVVYPTKPS